MHVAPVHAGGGDDDRGQRVKVRLRAEYAATRRRPSDVIRKRDVDKTGHNMASTIQTASTAPEDSMLALSAYTREFPEFAPRSLTVVRRLITSVVADLPKRL